MRFLESKFVNFHFAAYHFFRFRKIFSKFGGLRVLFRITNYLHYNFSFQIISKVKKNSWRLLHHPKNVMMTSTSTTEFKVRFSGPSTVWLESASLKLHSTVEIFRTTFRDFFKRGKKLNSGLSFFVIVYMLNHLKKTWKTSSLWLY